MRCFFSVKPIDGCVLFGRRQAIWIGSSAAGRIPWSLVQGRDRVDVFYPSGSIVSFSDHAQREPVLLRQRLAVDLIAALARPAIALPA
jgi:hypothetical protein